jgi:hypothetical protein
MQCTLLMLMKSTLNPPTLTNLSFQGSSVLAMLLDCLETLDNALNLRLYRTANGSLLVLAAPLMSSSSSSSLLASLLTCSHCGHSFRCE